MVFRLNVDKAIQAIAAFLHFHGSGEMSYLRMLKLLYLADRECLRDTGRPLTGDQVIAMKHGPVLGGVYDLIRGEHIAWPHWSKYLCNRGYQIELIQDPGNGQLSKFEIGKIRELTERYLDKNEWELVELTHELAEWKRNDPGNASKPIPLDHILEAIGRADQREAILQDAQNQAAFDRLFAEAAG